MWITILLTLDTQRYTIMHVTVIYSGLLTFTLIFFCPLLKSGFVKVPLIFCKSLSTSLQIHIFHMLKRELHSLRPCMTQEHRKITCDFFRSTTYNFSDIDIFIVVKHLRHFFWEQEYCNLLFQWCLYKVEGKKRNLLNATNDESLSH